MSGEDVGPLSRCQRCSLLPPEMHQAAAALTKLQFPSDATGSKKHWESSVSLWVRPLWGRRCAGSPQNACLRQHVCTCTIELCLDAKSQ